MTRTIDHTHDPSLRSWVASANQPGTDFPIQNLPFGVFRRRGSNPAPRIGVAIGDEVFDLHHAADAGLLQELPGDLVAVLREPVLNALLAQGAAAGRSLRGHLSRLLAADSRRAEPRALVPMADADMLVPARIGDYTDFYASAFHATRIGRLFRPDNPLLPNYKFVPIAYHGRASSIVVSGAPVRRPWGQTKGPDDTAPVYRPTRMLDLEVEAGIVIGAGNALGRPIRVDAAEDHVFGVCLLNDWSARDIQAWEYQPLGPFLAKNFATTLSPWVVTLDALAPFRSVVASRGEGDPAPLPHLAARAGAQDALDLRIDATITSAAMRERGIAPLRISRSSTRDLYWSIAQMIAHHTSNGCNLQPGDLLGTGTVSGAADDARGCLMEITANGRQPIELPGGEPRGYLADGDEVILRGFCERGGFVRIGFGECRGRIIPTEDS